ncbi:MAG: hypothetical protein K0Q78_339 [Cellvibrio sp.]|nr:hypothetical protein [Cellvibrio sp.]
MTPLERRIRELAYQIWESEGRPSGEEYRHWEMACKLAETPINVDSEPLGSGHVLSVIAPEEPFNPEPSPEIDPAPAQPAQPTPPAHPNVPPRPGAPPSPLSPASPQSPNVPVEPIAPVETPPHISPTPPAQPIHPTDPVQPGVPTQPIQPQAGSSQPGLSQAKQRTAAAATKARSQRQTQNSL